MKLPNANLARVGQEKVVGYLLCRAHPDGGSKARFFERFGFAQGEWEDLAATLREHGQENPVSKVVETGYGKRYIVDGPMRAADGRRPFVRTVWIIEEGAEAPRLITAHPTGKRT